MMKTIFVILWIYSSVPFTIGTISFEPGWWQAHQFRTLGVCEEVIEQLNINDAVVAKCLPAGTEPKDAEKPE